ncbi:uncharacterized protein LOC106657232 [Trichogramma pretiosum]|uniref:uncharacterized protein LOC106657232 n=1 Tax=Trichogramma pretiosum TaxID=7493 RepID=UPI0006C9782B|nr:uncharacterized protein LOC106657232 [Trichogramma pretiosum]
MATMGSDLLTAILQKTDNAASYEYNLWTDSQRKVTPTKTMIWPLRSGSVATTATMTTTSSEEDRAHFEQILQRLVLQKEMQQRLQRNEEFWRLFPHLRKPSQFSAEKAAHAKSIVAEENRRNYSYPNVQQQQQHPPQQQRLQNDREKDKKDDLDDSEQQRRRFWSMLTSKLPDDGKIKRESQLQHHLSAPAAEVEQQQQQIEAQAGEPPAFTAKIPDWARKRLPKTKYACRVCKKEFFKPHSVECHMILVHDASSGELTSNDESSFRSSAERAIKLSSVSSYPYLDDAVDGDYYNDDENDDVFNPTFFSSSSDVELAPPEFDERCQRIVADEMLQRQQQSTESVTAAADAERSCHLCKYCKLPFFYFNNYVAHLRAAHCFESELGARDTSTPMVPAGNAGEEDSFQLPQPGTQLLLASSYKYEDERKTPATPPPVVAPSRLEVTSDQNDCDEEDSDALEQPPQMPEKEQEQRIMLQCVLCNTMFFSMYQLNRHVMQYHSCKAAL